jgi:hypothetical protein
MLVAELQAVLAGYDPEAQIFVYLGNGYDRYLVIQDVEPVPYVHDEYSGERKYGAVIACYDAGG